jgi:hypothetical protein
VPNPKAIFLFLVVSFFVGSWALANKCDRYFLSNLEIHWATKALDDLGVAYNLENRNGSLVIVLDAEQRPDATTWAKMAGKIQKNLDHRVEFDEVWLPGQPRAVSAALTDFPFPRIYLSPSDPGRDPQWTLLALAHEAVHAKTNKWFLQDPESDESNWAMAFSSIDYKEPLHPALKNSPYKTFFRVDEVKAYYRGFRSGGSIDFLSWLITLSEASRDLLKLARSHLEQQIDSGDGFIYSVSGFHAFNPRHLMVEVIIPNTPQPFRIAVPYFNSGDVRKPIVDRQQILYRIKVAEGLAHRYRNAALDSSESPSLVSAVQGHIYFKEPKQNVNVPFGFEFEFPNPRD